MSFGRVWSKLIGRDLKNAQRSLSDSQQWARDEISNLKAQSTENRRCAEKALAEFEEMLESLKIDDKPRKKSG